MFTDLIMQTYIHVCTYVYVCEYFPNIISVHLIVLAWGAVHVHDLARRCD